MHFPLIGLDLLTLISKLLLNINILKLKYVNLIAEKNVPYFVFRSYLLSYQL